MKTTLKKIASLLICLCLIISGMVITASAAPTEIVFEFGDDNNTGAHADGSAFSAPKSYTNGSYTLTLTSASKCYGGGHDLTGKSALKLGTGSAVGSFTFTVPDDVTSVIFMVAKYKNNPSKISINGGAATTLSKSSDNGEYDAITIDTTTTKTLNFTTVSGGVRCMIDSITYVIEDTSGGEGGGTTDPEEPGTGGGETPDPEPTPDPEEPETPVVPSGDTATITFDNTSKRTEYSTQKQVWVENGITVTNNKASSSSNVGDYANPARFYKGSQLIIAASKNIAKIEFSANTTSYANDLKSSIGDKATVNAKIVTFTPDTPNTSFTFTLSGGQVRMDSITVTYEAKTPVAEFKDPQVDVADDLALNQTVKVNPEDVEGKKIEMQFTMNGVTTKVSYDASQIVNDKLVFTFDNIGIQCMADDIAMKLVTVDANNNEEVVQEETFSVKKYAERILKVTTDENTKIFVSNMLHYGAAAQKYYAEKYLNSTVADTELANYGVEGIVDAGNVEVPKACEMSLIDNASAGDIYFKGATVRFDNTNTLVIKLNAKTENTKVLIKDGDKEDKATLNGLECVITGLKATDYATKFTFELYEGDLLVQTLSYGINSYAFSKQTSTNMAALAKALYAYGASASAPAN